MAQRLARPMVVVRKVATLNVFAFSFSESALRRAFCSRRPAAGDIKVGISERPEENIDAELEHPKEEGRCIALRSLKFLAARAAFGKKPFCPRVFV